MLRECCRQSQAEVVSNSRKKIHQTWGPPFSRALYFPARVGSGRMRVGVRAGREGGYRVTSGPEGRKEGGILCANSMSAFSTPKSLKEREGKWMRNELPLYSPEAKEKEREAESVCSHSTPSSFLLSFCPSRKLWPTLHLDLR